MRATDLAQRPFKTGSYSPTYRLEIAGAHFGARLYDGSVTYSADGTSEMSISTDADLSDYTDARVRLEVGYGDEMWSYFAGYLEEPDDNYWGGPSTASAYGPFKQLAEGSLGADVDYSGSRLGAAISDLHRRAGRAAAGVKYEIIGNPSYLIQGEPAQLTISTSFADGIQSFLDLANWVSSDRPELVRQYRHRPRPRPSGKVVAAYSEAHYPPEGFKAVRAKRFGSVGAFARKEDGTLAWPVVKIRVDNVGRFKVSENRTYWLEDFSGDGTDTNSEAAAREECGQLAALMSEGTYSWSLSGISANPEIFLFDSIHVDTTELRDEGGRFKERYRVKYACAVDSQASIDVSREGNPMSLSGETAIKLAERKLAKPFYVGRGTTAVVS